MIFSSKKRNLQKCSQTYLYLKGYALCRRPPLFCPLWLRGIAILAPFGGLGASFLTFWEPFCHLGSTLGSNFGTSGTPWDAVFAPRDHPGGSWEQQDGHELANNMIFVDLGVISGLVYVGFQVQNAVNIVLFLGLFLCYFF